MQGEELRALRKGMKLRQAGLAEALGLSATFIGMMERGAAPIERRTALAVLRLADEHHGTPEPSPEARPRSSTLVTDVLEVDAALEAMSSARECLARLRKSGDLAAEQPAALRKGATRLLNEVARLLTELDAHLE